MKEKKEKKHRSEAKCGEIWNLRVQCSAKGGKLLNHDHDRRCKSTKKTTEQTKKKKKQITRILRSARKLRHTEFLWQLLHLWQPLYQLLCHTPISWTAMLLLLLLVLLRLNSNLWGNSADALAITQAQMNTKM